MISFSALTFMRLVFFYSDTHVRLTGYDTTYAGRVEVFSNGIWGRVLSYYNYWDQTEAAVVCRQLGFPGAITALRYSSFGEGSGPVLMSDVQCTGSEKTIQQCQYKDWVGSDLSYGLEVGVICKTHDFDPDVSEIQIRLQGSSVPNAGRVEVLYAGIWGAISRYSWDINEATVACRQLGYQAGAVAALKNGVYGSVSGPVWISNLHCSGSETNLMDCSHDGIGIKTELQGRYDVASVICKDGSLAQGMPVRIRGSSLSNMGRVEVYYAGKWGSISNSYWDIKDAKVVCRQLGYSTASLAGYSLFCSAAVPYWFTRFKCYGNESSLDQCAWEFSTSSSYLYRYCANVMCKDKLDDTGLEVRLSGSSVPHAGRVEIRFKGVWGTIGVHYFHFHYVDPEVANLICRQLNFTESILAFGWSVIGSGTGPQWFYGYELHCLKNESNLLNCSYREPHLTRQSYFSDLSVFCKPDASQSSDFPVRLTGPSLPYAGTIEVMYHGVWGGVYSYGVDSGVDINAGHVVCRQLGYPGAEKRFQYATFGQVKGPLWIKRIQCNGNETKISDCAVTTLDSFSSPSYQDPIFAGGVLCNEAHSSPSKGLNVRLAGAPINNAGRVEVFYAGVWGTVDSWGWDINDGHVVCRQLGYPGAISSGYSNQFGVSTGPVWFKNVRCLGNESNLDECLKDVFGYPNSNYRGPATVLCKLKYQSDNFLNCSQVKCANSGTCIKTAVGAICNCTDGFTGLHCEILKLNPCKSSPCKNGGKCFSNSSSFLCACTKGFTSKRCEEPIKTAIDPCQSHPCPSNTSCYSNKTHYYCVSNNIDTTPMKNSGELSTTAEASFIAVLSVSAAVIVLLIAAVVFLIFRNRRRPKIPHSNAGAVFNNMAFKDEPENNHNEDDANHSNDVDLGIGATRTQERQDHDAVYEEASRPLPPIPAPQNTTRKEEAGTRAAARRPNIAPVSVPRAREEHYMGLTQNTGNNTAPNVPPRAGAGTYSNDYMPLSSARRPGDGSCHSSSSRVQTSGARAEQHGNNEKRRKESREMYENTGK